MLRFLFRSTTGLLLLVTALLAPASSADKGEFVQRIERAFSHADKQAGIASLFHLENMDAEVRALYDQYTFPMLVKKTLKDVGFAALPVDFHMMYVREGYEYRPNLEPLGLVVINGRTKIPYGEHDGRYVFIGMQRTLVNADPPVEKTVQVMVYGVASEPVRFKGSCEVMQSNGETLQMQIEDNGHGNKTVAMNAVRVEACRVRNTSGDGQLTMRILEADEVIFDRKIEAPELELSFKRP